MRGAKIYVSYVHMTDNRWDDADNRMGKRVNDEAARNAESRPSTPRAPGYVRDAAKAARDAYTRMKQKRVSTARGGSGRG